MFDDIVVWCSDSDRKMQKKLVKIKNIRFFGRSPIYSSSFIKCLIEIPKIMEITVREKFFKGYGDHTGIKEEYWNEFLEKVTVNDNCPYYLEHQLFDWNKK